MFYWHFRVLAKVGILVSGDTVYNARNDYSVVYGRTYQMVRNCIHLTLLTIRSRYQK